MASNLIGLELQPAARPFSGSGSAAASPGRDHHIELASRVYGADVPEGKGARFCAGRSACSDLGSTEPGHLDLETEF